MNIDLKNLRKSNKQVLGVLTLPSSDSGRSPVYSDFNFLGEEYKKYETRTSLRKSMAAACAAAVVLCGAGGAWKNQSTDTMRQDTVRIQSEISETNKALNALDQAEGYSVDLLRGHVSQRQTVFRDVVSGEADIARIVSDIRGTLSPGNTLSSIVVTSPPPVTAAAGAQAAQTATTPSESPTTIATPNPRAQKIVISGMVTRHSEVAEWATKLRKVPGLENLEPTWSGGSGAVGVTFNATIALDATTARAKAADSADQYGFTQTGTTP